MTSPLNSTSMPTMLATDMVFSLASQLLALGLSVLICVIPQELPLNKEYPDLVSAALHSQCHLLRLLPSTC